MLNPFYAGFLFPLNFELLPKIGYYRLPTHRCGAPPTNKFFASTSQCLTHLCPGFFFLPSNFDVQPLIGSYRLPTHRRCAQRNFSVIPSYFEIKTLAIRCLIKRNAEHKWGKRLCTNCQMEINCQVEPKGLHGANNLLQFKLQKCNYVPFLHRDKISVFFCPLK